MVSALGLLSADFLRVAGVTRRTRLDAEAPAMLRDAFATFQAEAIAEFRGLGLDGALAFTLAAEMRFVGQAFEISVDLDPADLPRLGAADLAERFAAAHRRVYFHGGEPGRAIEIVGLRFGVLRRLDALPAFHERPITVAQPESVPVHLAGGTVAARLLDASRLTQDTPAHGPALIEGYSSSIWVPPNWVARRDEAGNLLMQRNDA